ncbi:periplasmic component of the Tol biopolymer transport system [Rivularia sp. PCC 7116]|uniref:TolB family protein n=1 Tax=Rivularia sp. PCC 7116 TaxID=373994 RepID=UPI00029EEF8D|nr:TolB family protein [Rivularia sp. PCC 7116]AFY53248.1 periplasmic component of the Tol biopolymer transport system [Rivularia sp. PCC 7116]
MKKIIPGFWLQLQFRWSLCLSLISLLVSCSYNELPIGSNSLNTRNTEEQPTLSGNGRFLAFVSNRSSTQQLLLYDLEQQKLIPTPRLNRRNAIAESPSLSYTGRYIVYSTTDRGRPVIALYDRAVGQSQVLTQNYNGWVRNPSVSPDGRYVVFETTIRGQWDIEVLDRGANVELDIPNGAPLSAPPQ